MSDNLLFNWGGRGPEWEAIQRKLEMDADTVHWMPNLTYTVYVEKK